MMKQRLLLLFNPGLGSFFLARKGRPNLIALIIAACLLAGCAAAPQVDLQATNQASIATLAALAITETAMAQPAQAESAQSETPASPTLPAADAAITPPVVQGTPVDPLQFGSLSGELGYPGEAIPPLRVVAFNRTNGEHHTLETAAQQDVFRFENLPPGEYQVVAYLLSGGELAGGYTQAVACGLSVECSDHSLVPVQVLAGQEASGVQVRDWYAPPGSFPADPLASPALPGKISGRLFYPSEGIPPLRVVAFHLDSGQYYAIDTQQNQATYLIEGLPPGVYQVVAYVGTGGLAGGYTQAVPCGLSVECSDHSLIPVQVLSGQETGNVDLADWYAPEGSFPPNPAP